MAWYVRLTWKVWAVGAAIALAAITAIIVLVTRSGGVVGTAPALLASPDGEPSGATVDGISCGTHEEALFHIHSHVAVYVDGSRRILPEGIGIAPPREVMQTTSGPFVTSGSCFYWLHTHTDDGIIHVEAPVHRSFTLGDFFDVWGQPLSASQVGPAHGVVRAYLNGQPFGADPRTIPLSAHAIVQLDVNSDIPPQPFTFPPGL